MIKNIIFDMVGVVIRFDTEKYYNDHGITSSGFYRFWPQVRLNKWFDDTMISADEGLVKPDPSIFRLACERFRIRPEESVFIDDMPMNVEAARGMNNV